METELIDFAPSAKFDEKFHNYLNPEQTEEIEAKIDTMNFESFHCNVCDKYMKFSSLDKLKEGFDKHQESKKHKINQLLSYSKQPDFHINVTKLQPKLTEHNRDFKTRYERKFKWMAYDRNKPYCTICRKYIGCKTAALLSHERTKKHMRNVLYQRDLRREKKRLEARAEEGDNESDYTYDEEDGSNDDTATDVAEYLNNEACPVPVGISDVQMDGMVAQLQEEINSQEQPETGKGLGSEKRYYNRLWENQFPWLTEFPVFSNKPYCRICKKYLSCKKYSLLKHEKSKVHNRLSKFHAKFEPIEPGPNFAVLDSEDQQDDDCTDKGQRRYQDYWERRFRWLLPKSPYNSSKTFCGLCKVELGVKKNTLVKHESSKQHVENEALARKSKHIKVLDIEEMEDIDDAVEMTTPGEAEFSQSNGGMDSMEFNMNNRGPCLDEEYEIVHEPSNTTIKVSSAQFSSILDRLNKLPPVKVGPSKAMQKKLLPLPECPFDVLWKKFVTTCLRLNVGDTIPTCVDCLDGELISKYLAKHILMHVQEEETYIKSNGHCKNCKIANSKTEKCTHPSPPRSNGRIDKQRQSCNQNSSVKNKLKRNYKKCHSPVSFFS